MTQAAALTGADAPLVLPELTATCRAALEQAQGLRAAAKTAVARLVAPAGRIEPQILEAEQFAAHGFAWLATYVAALEQMLDWAERLAGEGELGELES